VSAKQAPSKRIARMKHMASQNKSQISGTGSSAAAEQADECLPQMYIDHQIAHP
jgi:hypothetical protein